jgi:hypothetical protein
MTTRTITARYAGKCATCGGRITRGTIVTYDPKTRQVTHYHGCDAEAHNRDFIDIDRAYEDQCAEICGR